MWKLIDSSTLPQQLFSNKRVICAQNWWPLRCRLCGNKVRKAGLCGDCEADLPWYGAITRVPKYLSNLVIGFDYAFPIAQLVAAAKYERDVGAARLLARLISRCVAVESRTSALIPIPMPWRRFVTRGHNHALEIATELGALLGISVLPNVLVRAGYQLPQNGLSRRERISNIRDAFIAHRAPPIAHAVLIDDVTTTGATLRSAARAMRRAGTAYVSAWVVAAVR